MEYFDSANKRYAIMQIQQKLRELDYWANGTSKIAPDGIYGNMTRKAVKTFQEKYGINPTGVVDKETWDAINTVHKYIQNNVDGARAVYIFPKNKNFLILPGLTDDVMHVIIHMLNTIGRDYDDWGVLPYGNFYGRDVQDAIRSFQRKNLLDDNGVIDSRTFNRMADEYERINSEDM